MKPIFRWAGSKRKLIPELKKHIPEYFGTYYEPFCGSACLYFDFIPQRAVLSDLNDELVHSYKTIQISPELVHRNLEKLTVSKEKYNELRELDPSSITAEMRAARFLYLNRFCFNGVYRTNRNGKFNVPMGTKTGQLPDLNKLLSYSEVTRNVKFECEDFESSLSSAKENDFVYLDPPYSKLGSRNRGEYGPNSFTYLDIDRLLKTLVNLDQKGVKFLFSYCQSEDLINSLPKTWQVRRLTTNRHVAGFNRHRNVVEEILVFNDHKK